MNYRYILNTLSIILKYVSAVMLVPVICALVLKEFNAWQPFVCTSCAAYLLSLICKSNKETVTDEIDKINRSEALAIVLFTWILISILGSMPLLYFGLKPIDALFESVSGITTTGATILKDFSFYPQTMFFWRSFMQWLGGMGILVLFIAILPKFAVAGRQMFLAESPGANSTESKLTPRIRQTAAALWGIYFVLTVLECGLLIYWGMEPFYAVCNSMSTLAGGGLSPYQNSMIGLNGKLIWTITVFMFLSGMNFALQYKIYIKRKFRALFRDDEFKVYLAIVIFFALIIAVTLTTHHIYDFKKSLQSAFFQVISIITTTGFASVDYEKWNLRAKLLLFILMFSGASIGSAAGGVKILRLVLIFKYLKRQISKIFHPNGVYPIKINKAIVDEDAVKQIVSFVLFYYTIFAVSAVLLIFIEQNLVLGTTIAISTLGNVGPAFGYAGPMGNFSALSVISKIICIINMLIGRLELIPFLALLHPDFWTIRKNKNLAKK
ncbi:MAG: TrkH family potassium uptake protein [Candidatus Gastranaerophilales bacterium]|nr:TrkH family potassium uptake protein [Candidatus Gastranaerophilales bacterium]